MTNDWISHANSAASEIEYAIGAVGDEYALIHLRDAERSIKRAIEIARVQDDSDDD